MKHDFFKTLTEIKASKTTPKLNETNNFFQDINDNNGLDKTNSNDINSRTNPDKTVSKIPSDVMDAIKQRKKELTDSIDKFDNKGYNDHSLKAQAIECIDKIVELINNDEDAAFDGVKSAQIYFGTLMGPLMDLLPAKLIKFITSATSPSK